MISIGSNCVNLIGSYLNQKDIRNVCVVNTTIKNDMKNLLKHATEEEDNLYEYLDEKEIKEEDKENTQNILNGIKNIFYSYNEDRYEGIGVKEGMTQSQITKLIDEDINSIFNCGGICETVDHIYYMICDEDEEEEEDIRNEIEDLVNKVIRKYCSIYWET